MSPIGIVITILVISFASSVMFQMLGWIKPKKPKK